MNAPREQPATALDWTRANQQLLVAEFARLRALLMPHHDDDARRAPPADTAPPLDTQDPRMTAPAAIDTLAQRFGLSGFERDLLLLAAGVEMDATLAALCNEAQGRSGAPCASFGLALATLPDAHWSALAPTAALRRWRLLELDEQAGITHGRLRIDERILHYLAGLNLLDPRLEPLLVPIRAAGTMADAHTDVAERLAAALEADGAHPRPILFTGDDADGQRDVAAQVAGQFGLALFALSGDAIPRAAHERHALALLWAREAALLDAGLLIARSGRDDEAEVLAHFITHLQGLVFIAGPGGILADIDAHHHIIDKPDAPARRALWQQALAPNVLPARALDTLANRQRCSARQIARMARQLSLQYPDRPTGEADHGLLTPPAADGALGPLAQRIVARAGWADLVVPEAQRRMLQQVVVHTRHRLTVLHDWGFAGKGARGLGLAALFSGESGTGKTLAAEVLAHELGLTLYRIDLSAVVSKYIGETEKNLRRVFDAAEDVGAVLLFDEADALFGKRSEVKDSHDRYANIEVSYLLQRMEAYRGLAILTTNHQAALDTAFQRRLRFVVHFPFPDHAQREAIWRSVFPAATPLADVDPTRLAKLAVTGGTIRNIALSAAFLAADAGTAITMAHLREAAHMEAAKREKPFSDAETRGWS